MGGCIGIRAPPILPGLRVVQPRVAVLCVERLVGKLQVAFIDRVYAAALVCNHALALSLYHFLRIDLLAYPTLFVALFFHFHRSLINMYQLPFRSPFIHGRVPAWSIVAYGMHQHLSWNRASTMKTLLFTTILGCSVLVNAVSTPNNCANYACSYVEDLAAACQGSQNGTDCL